jgi:hypothetical protein
VVRHSPAPHRPALHRPALHRPAPASLTGACTAHRTPTQPTGPGTARLVASATPHGPHTARPRSARLAARHPQPPHYPASLRPLGGTHHPARHRSARPAGQDDRIAARFSERRADKNARHLPSGIRRDRDDLLDALRAHHSVVWQRLLACRPHQGTVSRERLWSHRRSSTTPRHHTARPCEPRNRRRVAHLPARTRSRRLLACRSAGHRTPLTDGDGRDNRP